MENRKKRMLWCEPQRCHGVCVTLWETCLVWCTGQAVTGQGWREVRVCFCVEAVTWNPRAGSHYQEQRLTNSGSSCPLYDLLFSFSVVLTPSPQCYTGSGQACSLGFLLRSQTNTFIKIMQDGFVYVNFFYCILLHEFTWHINLEKMCFRIFVSS